MVKMIRFVNSGETTIKDTFEFIEDYRTLHVGNQVTASLVKDVVHTLNSGVELVCVSFDVMGRTLHSNLACQLREQLGEAYCVYIDYDHYGCEVRKEAPPKRVADFIRLYRTSYSMEEDVTSIWCDQYIGEDLISTRLVTFVFGSLTDTTELMERVDKDSAEATFLMGQKIVWV